MNRLAYAITGLIAWITAGGVALAEPKLGKLPHVEFDVANRVVRVECEALNVDAPLEFFCCVTGTNEHESVLRTSAKPSDIQIGLLAIGLKPGQPLTFHEQTNKWTPPEGPPLHISVEYEKAGKPVTYPAYRWLRDIKTKKSPKAFSWVFTGSRIAGDGKFAADVTGYVVSVVNFDLTLIDIPELKSSSNELLELERNPELMPKAGTKVWMIIEPVGKADKEAQDKARSQAPAGLFDVWLSLTAAVASDGADPALPANAPAANAKNESPSPVHLNEKELEDLVKQWKKEVEPHSKEMRQAAETHYRVLAALKREQQRLIDEADRVGRAIDKLEKEYQDLTTPHPAEDQK